jgi:hypothetical protein
MVQAFSERGKFVSLCVVVVAIALSGCNAVEDLVGASSSNTEKRTVTGSDTMSHSNRTFQLITPAAEKEIHATLNAQWRWQNEQRAAQSSGGAGFGGFAQIGQSPSDAGIGFRVEFGTNFGYFPAPAPTSFVENGVRWWRVQINEGAKNSSLESVNYRITVNSNIPANPGNHPANWNDVRVEASIEYAPYTN